MSGLRQLHEKPVFEAGKHGPRMRLNLQRNLLEKEPMKAAEKAKPKAPEIIDGYEQAKLAAGHSIFASVAFLASAAVGFVGGGAGMLLAPITVLAGIGMLVVAKLCKGAARLREQAEAKCSSECTEPKIKRMEFVADKAFVLSAPAVLFSAASLLEGLDRLGVPKWAMGIIAATAGIANIFILPALVVIPWLFVREQADRARKALGMESRDQNGFDALPELAGKKAK